MYRLLRKLPARFLDERFFLAVDLLIAVIHGIRLDAERQGGAFLNALNDIGKEILALTGCQRLVGVFPVGREQRLEHVFRGALL